jgi:SOS-response transcriptional repressor LexA
VGYAENILAEAIQNRLNELETNAFAVEKLNGLPEDAIRSILKGGRKSGTSINRAQEICAALGIELYIGPPRETGTVYTTQIDREDFAAIPRVDARLAAGAGAMNGDVSLQGALAFRQDWLRERGISPAQACLLTVAGDSMSPTLHDGDLVMIDERRTTVRNRHVYAFVDIDGSARVKRVELVPDQLIILTSDNAAHPTETRTGPDMNRLRILGEIVWSAHAW